LRPDIWLVRHGETEWSATLRHTSRTDVELTDAGRAAATALAPRLAGHEFALVCSSPMARSRETARLAGFPDPVIVEDLRELDYGELEGLTTDEIRARGGSWSDWRVWDDRLPGGETLAVAASRARRVLEHADAAAGDVLLFGHGHLTRILTATALELDPVCAERFILEPAHVSVIGHEREARALRRWNEPVGR
jgi:probable phosphoglycerate mutase